MRRLATVTLGSAIGLAACAPRVRAPSTPASPVPLPAVVATTARSTDITVAPLGAFNITTGATFPASDGFPLGGLSACLREASGETLAISDSNERPFLYRLAVEWDGHALRVTPASATLIQTDDAGAPSRVDLEGLAAGAGDELILSTEGVGSARDASRDAPELLEYAHDGHYRGTLPLPPAYRASADGRPRGLRHNAAFEALTVTTEGRLLVGTEQPLAQDDEVAGIGRGAWGRLLEFERDGAGRWQPGRQFAYPIEPVPGPPGAQVRRAETGLVELLPVGPDRFIAMERSFVEPIAGGPAPYNLVRLYEVSLRGADNISGRMTISDGGPPRPVSKALIADLDDWRSALGPALPTLDNFEALCEGPREADGGRTVLLISDNNFNTGQRTVFVLARLVVRQ